MASARDLLTGTPTVERALGALEQLIEVAFTDPVTGLPNRRALDEIVKLPLTFERLYGVLMIDLTGFKRVNDEGGHGAGDAALKLVGETLSRMCREGPFVGAVPFRYGGDEFCVLVPAAIFDPFVDPSHLAKLSWRDLTLLGKALGFGAAIGIARPDGDIEVRELIDRADAAGKASKTKGDLAVFWSEEIAEDPTMATPRKRCGGCAATITIYVAQARLNADGFKSCPNCGAVLQ